MALAIGTQAPEFTLKSKTEDGLKDFSLSDHKGKDNVVLLFFPFAFTSVCVEEMCIMRDRLAQFSELDAAVYGISVDNPFAQEVMAKQDNINFPLLSDFNKVVSESYGVLYEDFIGYKGVAKRSAFVVNKEGEIIFASSSDDPKQMPDFDAIEQALSQ